MNNNGIVYICADVRSGSTLLDMLIGRHPLLTSVGELHHLYNYVNENYYRIISEHQKVKEDLCTCRRKFSECPLWSAVCKTYSKDYGISINSIKTRFPLHKNKILQYLFDFFIAIIPVSTLKKRITKKNKFSVQKKIAEHRFRICESINKITQSKYVLDSSKRIEGLKFLMAADNNELVKVIFLTRDLRSIAYSKFRRNPRSKLIVMMLQTLLFHLKLFLTVNSVSKRKRLIVRYEDLVLHTEDTLTRIFSFLGVEPNNKIDFYAHTESHILGGSPHKLNNKQLSMQLDERWKEDRSYLSKGLNRLLVVTSNIFKVK